MNPSKDMISALNARICEGFIPIYSVNFAKKQGKELAKITQYLEKCKELFQTLLNENPELKSIGVSETFEWENAEWCGHLVVFGILIQDKTKWESVKQVIDQFIQKPENRPNTHLKLNIK